MSRHVFASLDALAAEFIDQTQRDALQAIEARGFFSIGLTGGSAASALYPLLAQAALPWERVHVFFGDERAVPPNHKDSNYRLASELFLSRVRIPADNVHRIEGEISPEQAASRYERELLDVAQGALDVLHVGVGSDGHVFSLFAGHPALTSTKRVEAVLDAPKPPMRRITLTPVAARAARKLLFLVLGDAKADAVRDVILDANCALPAAIVARGHSRAEWLLDDGAAKFIRS